MACTPQIANPSFSRKTVQGFATIFNENAKELAEVLTKKDPNEVFNTYFDVVYTQNVCRTIMGLSREESKHIKSLDLLVQTTREVYDFIFVNCTHWWYQFSLFYWLLGRWFAESMIKITLAHVVRRVKLSAVGPPIHQLPLIVAISVEFAKDFLIKAEPRQRK